MSMPAPTPALVRPERATPFPNIQNEKNNEQEGVAATGKSKCKSKGMMTFLAVISAISAAIFAIMFVVSLVGIGLSVASGAGAAAIVPEALVAGVFLALTGASIGLAVHYSRKVKKMNQASAKLDE